MKKNKVLITGGTGSWGEALVMQLLNNQCIDEIRVLSRNEARQVALKEKIQDKRVRYYVGDIRDKDRLLQACDQVNIVYHLAALKHVPVCEEMPLEAVKTNILGTQNVIDASIQCGVAKVIYISTDKAADPNCVYGCTKTIGEKLIIDANANQKQIQFTVLRSGNLLGSEGSVIPLFKKQIQQFGKVKVTNKNMSRFFISITEAVSLLLEATEQSIGGEIFIMKMPAINIGNLAQSMLQAYGKDATMMEEIGVRAGEKMSEVLVSTEEKNKIFDFNSKFYVIPPQHHSLYPKKTPIPLSGQAFFDSANAVIDLKSTYTLLKNAHCIEGGR